MLVVFNTKLFQLLYMVNSFLKQMSILNVCHPVSRRHVRAGGARRGRGSAATLLLFGYGGSGIPSSLVQRGGWAP